MDPRGYSGYFLCDSFELAGLFLLYSDVKSKISPSTPPFLIAAVVLISLRSSSFSFLISVTSEINSSFSLFNYGRSTKHLFCNISLSRNSSAFINLRTLKSSSLASKYVSASFYTAS